MTEIELGWLAGIIDGEGSITLSPVHRYDREHTGYGANISISSTTPIIIDKVVAILKDMGLDPKTSCIDRSAKGHKDALLVRINNKWEIERLLHRIKDHLVLKKEHAFWMIEYFKQRDLEGRSISQFSHEIAEKVRSLNKRYPNNTTKSKEVL